MAMTRSGVAARVCIVLAAGLAITIGGYGFHKYRKRTAVRKALEAGSASYNAKHWSQAADNLGRYLTAWPRDVDVLMKYADAQMRRRPQTRDTMRQAASALETVLRVQPGDPAASKTLAEFYLAIGAPIEAERVSRAWLATHPEETEAQLSLAAALIPQEKYEDAIKILEPVVAAHPERHEAAGSLAYLWVTGGKKPLPEAVKILDAAVAARPEAPAARLARARFLLATGQFAKARPDIEAVENLESKDPHVLLSLGSLLADVGFYERANVQFDKAEKLAPDSADAYAIHGKYLLDAGDFVSGAKMVDRALAASLGEQRLDLLSLGAELYALANQAPAARKCIDELKTVETPSEALLYLEGLTNIADGRMVEGIAALRETTKRAPKFAKAHLALGRAYVLANDLRQAATSLEEAVRLADDSILARVELANAYAGMGRHGDAARVAMQAERQAPLNSRALMASLEMQALAARPGGERPDPAAIQSLYKRVKPLAERATGEPRLRMLLARLAAWQGQIDEAGVILRPLLEDAETSVVAAVLLADLYGEAGQYGQAIEVCREALGVVDAARRPALQAKLAGLYAASGQTTEVDAAIAALATQPASPARSAAMVNLADSLARTNERAKARELLTKVVAEDATSIQARLLLLRMGPADNQKPSPQDLVDQIRRIEGEEGVTWRLWQARVWLAGKDDAQTRQKTESILKECISRRPDLDEPTALLARLYERSGDSAKALDLYEQALRADPRNARLAASVLAVMSRAQRWDKADQVLTGFPADTPELLPYFVSQAFRKGDAQRAQELLRSRIKSDPADYRSRLQLASVRRLQGDVRGAGQLLGEAAQIAPDAVDVLAARVDLHMSLAEYAQAVELCNQALAEGPQPRVLLLRAVVYETMDRLADAQKDLEQAGRVEETAEQACLSLGLLLARHDRRDEALAIWRQGIGRMPESVTLRQALTDVLLSGDETQRREGLTMLEALLAQRPDDERLLTMKARFEETRDLPQAEALYEKITRLHPGAAEAYHRLARMAMDRGQRERAMTVIDQGLAGSPRNLDLLIAKAELLSADSPGRAAVVAGQAEAAARQVLAAQPNSEQAAITLAQTLVMAGDVGKAIGEMRKFLARKETDECLDARLVLANLCLHNKDAQEADSAIREATAIAPDDPRPVQSRISWHAAMKQWNEVQRVAGEFAGKHPEETTVRLTAAQALSASGEPTRIRQAVEMLESTPKTGPGGAYVWSELGLARYRLNQIAEARAAFEQALEAQPGHAGFTNNLAWIVCEEQKDPAGAEKIIGDTTKTDTGTADYASLLDTCGVVEYRLGVLRSSQEHRERSRQMLEACMRHPQASEGTKVSAMFHLARTLTDMDGSRSRQILEGLLGDARQKAMLSPTDQEEAAALLHRLQGAQVSGVAG